MKESGQDPSSSLPSGLGVGPSSPNPIGEGEWGGVWLTPPLVYSA